MDEPYQKGCYTAPYTWSWQTFLTCHSSHSLLTKNLGQTQNLIWLTEIWMHYPLQEGDLMMTWLLTQVQGHKQTSKKTQQLLEPQVAWTNFKRCVGHTLPLVNPGQDPTTKEPGFKGTKHHLNDQMKWTYPWHWPGLRPGIISCQFICWTNHSLLCDPIHAMFT